MDKMENPMLPEMTELWQQTLNWQPDAFHLRQFQRLYELICQGNQQLNLTRITEATEFWEKHLWDSLRGIAPLLGNAIEPLSGGAEENFLQLTPQSPVTSHQSPIPNPQVIDIGTGAGFPGIPIAIIQPNWNVKLLDSTRKKIAFLETLLTELGIQNATTLTGRAEELGQQPQHREFYDIALLRALGSASVCAEYALPLLKIGGLAILYRGQWTDEETEALRSPVTQLGGKIESIEGFTTPISNSIRHCIYLRKVAPTPRQFPRPTGVPTQKPL